ncbi:hypothetical protein [Polynucleobacter asymbioticus]|jgi:hypothetical protein|uniref:DUF1488 domain-containing protein n=1 Tax=Polynucleobacter asymbioticus (strain DSM 18221 / CIP 109841 / QLW-P1DMWA-1) TaxID=312153 RepID=A4T0L5_POLAQ|nr:hypothetical protein [Polynucleobacter asymbioticus]ABP35279.1 hypothetical protein Pnuc_2068 [Polynucleobacter asymbioticus QLW-P1DMWA-1]MBT8573800.1 DUF1488 domain-containing protein [Polynucleobacter paneuropaeus]
MKIEFIGPATIAEDGGINYPAKIDGRDLICHFSYEVLEDIDPEAFLGNSLEHFAKHQLALLSIAEQKILGGHAHSSKLQIFSNDLPSGWEHEER